VATLTYLPFCFFNYLSPGLSVLYGFTGFRIEKTEPARDGSTVTA
jgi:Na+:H+ antiporter, NhaC family